MKWRQRLFEKCSLSILLLRFFKINRPFTQQDLKKTRFGEIPFQTFSPKPFPSDCFFRETNMIILPARLNVGKYTGPIDPMIWVVEVSEWGWFFFLRGKMALVLWHLYACVLIN